MRLIDADSLIDYLKEMWGRCGEDDWYEAQVKDACEEDVEIVNKQPTIDAVPVMHGEWIENSPIKTYCSICGWASYSMLCEDNSIMMRNNRTPYCPNCGAKMDSRAGVFE